MVIALPALPAIAEALAYTAVAILGAKLASDTISIAGDYLDSREKREVDSVLPRVGEISKAERRKVDGCEQCKWCQIVIQAQGILIGSSTGATVSLGPYFVSGRTVWTSEGVTVLAATHTAVKKEVPRRNFSEIEALEAFDKTARYINARPPGGLPPRGDYRANVVNPGRFRYDINVQGNINAFMA